MATNGFQIKDVQRILLDVPFHERSATTMEIRVPGWSIVELCRITTSSGVVGVGETITNYTWGRTGDKEAQRVLNRNLFDHLWDDSLGAGLQMALFDAAGKLLGVPCHRLLGTQYRDACPISWWSQDMPPEAWAQQAEFAVENGYIAMKAKARPWFDVDQQMAAVTDAVPPHFRVDLDFNGTLVGVDQAAPLISRLEQDYRMLAIVETPIPQADVAGNALLRQKIQSPIAMHMGSPPVMTAIREGVCDGFVIGGGASRVLRDGTLAERSDMPFWLQLVGTGLTTAFSVHLGAVLSAARWPAISCLNIYKHPLVTDLQVEGGHIAVPDQPGLGVELDWDAVERLRVDPDYRKPVPRQIHTISWPDGRTTHYPDGQYRDPFLGGKLPGFLPGISLEYRLDDQTDAFDREYTELFPGSDGPG